MAVTQDVLDAIEQGDEAGALALIDRDPKLAIGKGSKGESLVLAAVYRGQARLTQAIARIRPLELTEAAALGDSGAVGEIIRRDPAALRSLSPDGWTPLHLAAFLGHSAVARQLLDAGADLEAYSNNSTHNRPLHAALAGKTDVETVRLLIERGAEVGAKGASAVTPLHLAASRGATDLIALLLSRGADRGATLDDGATPAALARQRGHPKAAEMLEAKG